MEPTSSPIMADERTWSIGDAATFMQDVIIGQAAWRYRVGREFESLLSEVDGISLVWKEEQDTWVFTFSVRRGGFWSKSSVSIDAHTDEVEHEVRSRAFDMMGAVIRRAFPEVAKEEDERREREGVVIDE